MTKREAIESYFNFDVPEKLIDKVVIDRAIKDNAEYSSTDQETVEVAVADICGQLVNWKQFTEGELTIVFDLSALRSMRTELLSKWNKTSELSSTIQSRQVW